MAAMPADAERQRRVLIACAALALAAPIVAGLVLPAMAQPGAYYNFADQRICGRVPHALNTLSNLPFLLVGLLGLDLLRRRPGRTAPVRSVWPYGALFTGVALTAFGSGYFHANPGPATLVWDRLPMALGFAGLVAGTLEDRGMRAQGALLVALAVVSIGSVLLWAVTGNLVPYLAMQMSFMAAALLATALTPSLYTHAKWLYGALAVYALAVVCERLDWQIFVLLQGTVSGHTLKHLVAATAIFVLYLMLKRRTPRIGTAVDAAAH